jgi:UrcA family protein
MNKIICVMLAASAVFGAVATAQAEDGQMRVKLADVNMSSEAGAKAALARISWSAESFCEATSGRQSLERMSVMKRCIADMTRRGVEKLNAPAVTALMQETSGVKRPTQVAMAR